MTNLPKIWKKLRSSRNIFRGNQKEWEKSEKTFETSRRQKNVITVANSNKGKVNIDLNWTKNELTEAQEIWMAKMRLVLICHVIGLEGGASFLNQLQGDVTENWSNPELLMTPNENC